MVKHIEKFLKSNKKHVFIYIIFSLLSSVLSIMIPTLIGRFIDNTALNKNLSYIKEFLIYILPLLIVSHIINYYKLYKKEMLKFDCSTYLNERVLINFIESKYDNIKDFVSENIIKRFITSIDYISEFLIYNLAD